MDRIKIPMPNLLFMFGTALTIATLNALADGIRTLKLADPWYVQAGYLTGFVFAGAVKGALIAGVLWLIAKGASSGQSKNPKPWMLKTGTVVYWLGFALGVYCIVLAIYTFGWALYTVQLDRGAISAITLLAGTGFSYWFAGRGIRYMLGK